jgi:hypothetical protein
VDIPHLPSPILHEHFNVTGASWHPERVQLPELDHWLTGDDRYYTLVKHNRRRSVYALRSVPGAEPSVFLKYLHPRSFTEIVKNIISPRVLREYRTGKALEKLHLPVPASLACAWKAGHGILVTRAIPNAQTGMELWGRVRHAPAQRKQYLGGLARFLAQLLKSNVWHTDFHLGNLLAVEQEQTIDFYLIDLYEVRLVTRLSLTQKYKMLELLAVFQQEISQDEAKEILDFALQEESQGPPAALWQGLCHRAVEKTQRRWTNRRKELLRSSSVCQKVKSSDGTWLLRRGFEVSVAEAVVRAHHDLRGNKKQRLLHESSKRCVFRVEAAGTGYVVREYLQPGLWKRFSADCQSWLHNWRLEMYGIPVAKCLAWLRAKDGQGYMISEYIPGIPYNQAVEQSIGNPERQIYLTSCLEVFYQRLALYGIGSQGLTTRCLVVPDPLSYRSLFPQWYPDTLVDRLEVFLVDGDVVQCDHKGDQRSVRHTPERRLKQRKLRREP